MHSARQSAGTGLRSLGIGTQRCGAAAGTEENLADGEGFEPSVPLWGTHAFQASPFDRSGTHPIAGVITVLGFDSGRKPEDFPMARESQKDAGECVPWVPADWVPI